MGIHDLSRSGVDERSKMARFNMPFELGLFLGARWCGGKRQQEKQCLLFHTEQFTYHQFISDIAGQDIEHHNNNVENLINSTTDWLNHYETDDHWFPVGDQIVKRFVQFDARLIRGLDAKKQSVETLSWKRLLQEIRHFIQDQPIEIGPILDPKN